MTLLPKRWGRLGDRRLAVRLPRLPEPYEADEADAATFRARQLQALLKLTPLAMVINVLNATLIGWAVWQQTSPAFMLLWAGAVNCLAGLGLRGWLRARRRPGRLTASRRAVRHAVLHAGLLGSVWAALPIGLFGVIDADAQFVVGMVVTGMICAGGFALSSVPMAATVWVLMLGLGSVAALWQSPTTLGGVVGTLLLVYCVTVIYSAWASARTLGARLVAEARADRQHEVIGLLLRDFEDHASDLLWELDARGRFRHVSERLARSLGAPAPALQRLKASRLLVHALPDDAEARSRWELLRQRLAAGEGFREQLVVLAQPDGPAWWSLSARPLFDKSGGAVGWRGVATNVTDRHLTHRRLSWLAHNDPLTGLANRNRFREELHALLQGLAAAPDMAAVVLTDLDGFKQVNDTYGHAAGDELLGCFAARLSGVTRLADTVARLGGDEFAILLRGVRDADDVRALVGRLLAALAPPTTVRGHAVALRASLGVAMLPADGQDVDVLMNHADVALYEAKRGGGGRVCFFDASMAQRGRRRLALEVALRDAASRGELRLVFQPQVAADTHAVVGFEALLRWRHAELGEVSPVEFVPIAEAAGLMPAIGGWVLKEACAQAARWPEPLRVSINVSATQLGRAGFVEQVVAAAQGLAHSRVELEITESTLIEDVERAARLIDALRGHGLRVALDDFGTGYSALGYLRRFSFDTLKIDRSFVRDLASDGKARVILETILAMSHALGVTAVAEGVERPEQAALLQARGCAVLQGFVFSRPLEAAAVAPFLRRWRAPKARPAAGVPGEQVEPNGCVASS